MEFPCKTRSSGLSAALAQPPAPRATKAVLLLSSERYDFPATAEFERGLRDGLADPAGSVEFYVDYLDVGRFPASDYSRTTARYLAERYAGRRIDVVVALVDTAFEFALAHRARLFPGVGGHSAVTLGDDLLRHAMVVVVEAFK